MAPDPPKWSESLAYDYLYKLVSSPDFPTKDQIKPKQVYLKYCKDRDEFKDYQDYTALKFAGKLNDIRDKIEQRIGRAKEDAAFLAHDRLVYPQPTHDTAGRPMWQKSKAQELLRQDIKDGTADSMKPRLLFDTREEYYNDYTLDFFRERIYKEKKWMKRQAWLKKKAEEKKQKEEGKKEKTKGK